MRHEHGQPLAHADDVHPTSPTSELLPAATCEGLSSCTATRDFGRLEPSSDDPATADALVSARYASGKHPYNRRRSWHCNRMIDDCARLVRDGILQRCSGYSTSSTMYRYPGIEVVVCVDRYASTRNCRCCEAAANCRCCEAAACGENPPSKSSFADGRTLGKNGADHHDARRWKKLAPKIYVVTPFGHRKRRRAPSANPPGID